MNLLKKLNTYLLENHPLTWHSKVIQLTLAGVLFWIISYFIGYALIDLQVLQNERILNYYFESSFVYFHVIYCVTIISIWAFYFYKNNAFKNLYPIKKGYFLQLFFYLFIPFTILVNAYYPFTKGCKEKTSTFFDTTEIGNEIDKLNLGAAFLISYPGNYSLENRIFPKPYPVEIATFDENQQKWSEPPYNIYKTNGKNKTYWTPENYDEKYTIKVDGRKKQFFASETVETGTPCHYQSFSFVKKMYSLEELDHPELWSVLNYSSILIDLKFIEGKENSFLQYSKNYAPTIYDWVRNKKITSIQKSIDEFKQVCDKYEIDYRINTSHIIFYLKFKKFKNIHHSIVNTWRDNSGKYNHQDEVNQIQSMLTDTNYTIENMEYQHAYYYDNHALQKIFDNFSYTNNPNPIEDYSLLFFLCLSLGITWLFLWFEFTDIKSLLITIPIVGILIVLNFLIVYLSRKDYYRDFEDDLLLSFIITFLTIISFTLFSLKTKKIKKKIANILVNLCYVLSPYFFIFTVILYNEKTKNVIKHHTCSGRAYESIENSFLIEPYFFFFYTLIGILLFLPLLKKWKAYEES